MTDDEVVRESELLGIQDRASARIQQSIDNLYRHLTRLELDCATLLERQYLMRRSVDHYADRMERLSGIEKAVRKLQEAQAEEKPSE